MTFPGNEFVHMHADFFDVKKFGFAENQISFRVDICISF